MQYIKIKRLLLMVLLALSLLLTLSVGIISAWLIATGDDSYSATVGKVNLDMSTSPDKTVNISLTSPTFLLDPSIIDLYLNSKTYDPLFLKHSDQFGQSTTKITITLINKSNVPGVIGYGNDIKKEGINLSLIDKDLVDNQNDLAGIAYVILPHGESLTENSFYTYLLNELKLKNQSLSYIDFASLKSSLNIINNETIQNAKSKVYLPNDIVMFDVFIWQEYYDGANYVSQYDKPNSNNTIIFKKQEISFEFSVFFGQTGIK